MRKVRLLGSTGLGAAAFAFVAASSPAHGQETNDTGTSSEVAAEAGETGYAAAAAETNAPDEAIVVTGSRIRSPNLDSVVPVTSVGAAELLATGDVSVGDALNDLPSLRSTFSQANSTRFIGTAGLNILDLRGLGTSRTLVLVNGRRHITASPGDYMVDVNTIPADLLERVDVITGGSSAVYGSDAVAGVVNFVLKRDFEGIKVNGQAGISEHGDRPSHFVSAIAGKNFAGGRGNIAAAFEYAEQGTLYYTDRPGMTGAYSGRRQFQLSDDTAGEPAAGDNIPDYVFRSGIRNANIADEGLFRGRPGANGFSRNYVFDRNGNLQESVCDIDFRPVGSGNCQGGLGTTLVSTEMLQPGLKRYAGNILARFEVSEGFQPFLEAKYVHVDAVQSSQPSFFQGGALGTFSIDNPFLTEQARSLIVANRPDGATTFALNRFNVDFGGRGELHDRDTFRIVGGVEGDFNDDWHYEVALNYGQVRNRARALNNLVISRYLNAIDAVRNPGGEIVCGINADSDPTNDDAACAPINLFGPNQASQAALDYVNTTSVRKERASEFVASAFVSGDSSQLFELPGGPVRFAVGGEYRKETAFSAWDDLVKSDDTFLNAIQDFDPPAFEVKEAFGELSLPIFRNAPLAEELTVSLAGRVSDYKGSTGTVFAYNAGAVYAPIPEVKFRGNYSRSVRAPTQTDLYSPASVNFGFLDDPCDVLNINSGSPNRAANCAAAGIPVGFVNQPARDETLRFTSAGNAELEAEKSDSYTLGVVLQPTRFVPGLSLSVDYYNIAVKNLIAYPSLQEIVDTCYDAASLDNIFCSALNRGSDGLFDEDSAGLQVPFNFARQKTSGVDFDLAYRRNFGDVRLDLRGIASYIIERTNYMNTLDPTEPDRQKSELGDPAWEGQVSANLDFGKFDLGYKLRYIGKQTIGTYETQHAYNGNPPENADAYERAWYPDVFYHDLRAGFDVNKKFRFYGGVDNLFDRKPPYNLLGVAGGDPFDNVGRFFYVGASANF